MRPWIDRKVLIKEAKDFVRRNGYFLRQNAHRISSLVEVAVYNSIVEYYRTRGFMLEARNLGPKKSFRYKVSSTGLTRNFSYFRATEPTTGAVVCIFHNTRIQSAHHAHLYYTPDVAVCDEDGNVTERLKSGRDHSYIVNAHLLTFAEVKHLPPFPEALFSFTGLVQEFMPGFIAGTIVLHPDEVHLSPILVFTGVSSEHNEKIRTELGKRYGINIVFGTQKSHGQIANFDELRKYVVAAVKKGAAKAPDEVIIESRRLLRESVESFPD